MIARGTVGDHRFELAIRPDRSPEIHPVGERFWRDAGDRLTFDLPGVVSTDYPAVCRAIADAFDLVPAGEIVVGPVQIFWDFRLGSQVVSFDWDTWMDFMVVAPSAASELLVRGIAAG